MPVRIDALTELVKHPRFLVRLGGPFSRPGLNVPPYATVQGYWYAWRDEGRWEMINHARSGRQELEGT